ncbi:LysR family transcriptional regulator [Nocardiopsis sp. MG754419]|uniref:LysR family transcriptional regulator n=1 Tax=Nocardiopsis sp. MG754419 TaxID=2259865 RepID=UPI001BAA1287|nr:LysR family transcriptional regulator [Nocardiopsis sp. MG754419]MBR8743252.1 LysR family transcriptional regulator [Nocardiopsis sp. MG754419]
MDLNLRQLEVFATVARCGSFTDAAERLHVAQSSLSRTVMAMERGLGVPLLERTTRKVRCTPEGAEVLAVAERLLSRHRAEMNGLERYLRGDRGTVTVSTLPSLAATLLPPAIVRLREEAPEIDVHVLDGMAESALDRLEAGESDLALVAVGRPRPGTRARALVRDRFLAVLPPDHPLGEREETTWSDLAEAPFVVTGGDSSVRRVVEDALDEAGVLEPRLIQAGNISTVGGLVGAGIGVSALPALALPLMGFADHVRVPLRGPATERLISVVVPEHRTPGPAVERFLRVLWGMRATDHPLPDGAAWQL